ncbi:hypothetical protein [Nitrosopumilus sp.]|uniref:hypothetical protein n=1 Tax=Nitrosopumilus sp. TaxID=2024843 RepID=UPI0034A086B8
MDKNSSIIAGIIGITVIIILGAYFINEYGISDISKEKEIQQENDISVENQQENDISVENQQENDISEVDKKLNDIEKKASENQFTPEPREWITSGPFQIDRSQYHLGEKIFLRIGGLDVNEKGQVAFLRPLNETHYSVYQTIPFDGTQKNAFNYYLDVRLSKALGICTVEDITRGEWAVVFRGTDYPTIKFKFTDEFIPGEEDAFEDSPC